MSSFPDFGVTAAVTASAAFLRLPIFFNKRNISLHFLCSGSCFKQLVMWLLANSYMRSVLHKGKEGHKAHNILSQCVIDVAAEVDGVH